MNAFRIDLGQQRRREEAFLSDSIVVRSARGVRAPDALLLNALESGYEGRALVRGSGEGVVAMALRHLYPELDVRVYFDDAFERLRAWHSIAANDVDVFPAVAARVPEENVDLVFAAFSRRDSTLTTLEFLQQAFHALRRRGKLIVAVDQPRELRVRQHIETLFGSVTLKSVPRRGVVYVARKHNEVAGKMRMLTRDFSCRLFGQDLELRTRPGVFSHGELDEGTLALCETAGRSPLPVDARVADFGCGAGAVGIAAAKACSGGAAFMIDSSARAAAMAQANVCRNGVAKNALVLLAHDAGALADASCTHVLANPPYFSSYRISQVFVEESHRLLRPQGQLFLVTKSGERHVEIIEATFGNSKSFERRGYTVVRAER